MKPESQALVREFNRRLRSALAGAPNHVRVESALEVESHVLDMLSRGTADLPETEMVARILAGFGSPEEYARALLDQLPGAETATVGSGLRDVGLSLGDLLRGLFRLGLAMGRQVRHLLVTALKLLWQLAVWVYGTVRAGVVWVRGPLGNLRRWLTLRGKVAWYGLRRGSNRGRVLAVAGGRKLQGAAGRGFGGVVTMVRSGIRVAEWTLRTLRTLLLWSYRTVRAVLLWTLRAAGVVFIGGLALLALLVGGFTALAPDIVGWWVQVTQYNIARTLDEIRYQTGVPMSDVARAELAHTGSVVFAVVLTVAVLLVLLLGYIAWNSRRRRSDAARPAAQ